MRVQGGNSLANTSRSTQFKYLQNLMANDGKNKFKVATPVQVHRLVYHSTVSLRVIKKRKEAAPVVGLSTSCRTTLKLTRSHPNLSEKGPYSLLNIILPSIPLPPFPL